jgi:hypothetical protein
MYTIGVDGLHSLVVGERAGEGTHDVERQSSARGVTTENYSGVGSIGGTNAINRPPSAKPTGRQLDTARVARPTSLCPTRLFGGW